MASSTWNYYWTHNFVFGFESFETQILFPEPKIADDTISNMYQYFSINIFLLITENFSGKVWRRLNEARATRFF